MVTSTVSAAAQAAAKGQPAVDASRLADTLDGSISARTLGTMANNPPELRAAMLLGSPDFMQH
jgi:hypothetical protein